MNASLRYFLVLTIVSILCASCGGAAATEAPAATEPPALATEPTGPTEAPVTGPSATEPAVSSPPVEAQPIANLVVILVVDNFTSSEENTSDDGACTVTADGQGLGHARGSSMTILGKPHGLFVYGDLLHQIQTQQAGDGFGSNSLFTEGQGFDGAGSLDPSIGAVRLDLYGRKNSDQALLVVAVDTNGFNIDNIASNIPAAIAYFAKNSVQLGKFTLPPTEQIVVNMSFVLIPCNPEKTLGASLGVDLTGWLDKLRMEFDQHGDFYNAVYSIPAMANLGVRFDDLYGDVRNNQDSESRNGLRELSTDLYTDKDLMNAKVQEFNNAVDALNQLDKQVLIDNAVFQAYVVYLLYYDGSTEPPPYPDDLKSIYDPISNPPLKIWTSQQGQFYSNLADSIQNYPHVVFVGASGNLGYPYPFAPASWDFVGSISSEGSKLHEITTLDSGLSLATYSNWGEIQMDGNFTRNPKHIYGTSFAAPKFSYQIARYLLDGGSSPCPQSPSILPVLGFATNKIVIFSDSSGNSISNNNMTFSDAMAKYCP